jgi:hypothetical protein
MGTTFNFIDESERLFLEQSTFVATNIDDLWSSNGTIATDATEYLDADFGSLKLTPSSVDNYVRFNYHSSVVSVPSQYAITTDADGNDFIEAFMWVKSTKNCTLYLQIELTEVSFDSATSSFEFIDPFSRVTGAEGSHTVDIGGTDTPIWQLIRAVPVAVPSTGRWSIGLNFRVVFETLTGAFLNIARPSAYQSQRFLLGDFLNNTAAYLPEVFIEADTANFSTNNPTYPLMRFLDVITTTASEVYDQAVSFEYLDASEGGSSSNLFTLSRLVDPRVCDSSYLSWLAQFRGRPVLITYQPSTEGIGWSVFTLNSSLLSGLDPITNLPVGIDVLGSDATNLGGLPAGVEAFARWQVETGYYGHNAGTVSAMVNAIQRNLTGDQTVNYTLSTNTIAFTTKQSETFGSVVGDVGTSNSVVMSLIEPARPLGMLVTHTMTA